MGSSHSHPPACHHSSSTGASSMGLEPGNRRPTRPAELVTTQAATTGLANANMEDQKHAHEPLEKTAAQAKLQQLQNKLLDDLQSLVGQQRAKALYRAHVCRSHFLLVHGAGQREATLAEELRVRLEEEGQVVVGSWSIIGGENMLDAWQKLSSRAMAVVVMLSPALFQDTTLCSCLLEMQHSHPDTIVPLFLEPLSLNRLPPRLAFLTHTIGRVVPQDHWDAHHSSRPYWKNANASGTFVGK
ncbi:hypothetical protein GWK47_040643 [Chionoecetes opilio]|uniref:TIR domain-containing protein n=1 Tax=Chionoecetes opilio TaxID=41210 RepID=A0A8J4YAI0_CHIOP|nr:hypothetical protein GWK47_040643 [Chionoecetes opilio]